VLTDRGLLQASRHAEEFHDRRCLERKLHIPFSIIGLYGKAYGLPANPSVTVPASFGLIMMLMFTHHAAFEARRSTDLQQRRQTERAGLEE
jgi:hypothetical protein